MQQDNDPESERQNWSRRNVLTASAVGAGLAAIGGTSLASGGDGENGVETDAAGTETPTATPGTETGDDGAALVDDLIDPVFGYPLTADEADEVDVEPVVELHTVEGEGAHPDFPQQPGEGGAVPFEFAFDPVGIQVEPGDVVEFNVRTGEHTVTAFHEKFGIEQRPIPTRVPEAVPGFTSPPILDGESWLYDFPTSGVYDILCLPHMAFGMVMRVVAFDPDEDDIGSDTFAVDEPEDISPNPRLVLTAEELDPANIVDAGTVGWADLTLDVQQMETPGTPTEQPETLTE